VEVFPEPNAKVPGLVVEDAKLSPVATSALDWNPEPSVSVLGTAPKEKPLNAGAVALVPLVPNKRGGAMPMLDPNELRPPPLPSATMGTAMGPDTAVPPDSELTGLVVTETGTLVRVALPIVLLLNILLLLEEPTAEDSGALLGF